MAPALSAFEARRQANVANNTKLLKETAEIGAKMKRAAAPPPRVSAPKRRKVAAEPTPKTRVMPTRQSRRLAGGDASEGIKVEDIPLEIKDREPKRTRIGGDMNLASLQVDGNRWSDSDALASFRQGAQPGVRTFNNDDIKEEDSDEKLASLRKDMSELNIYEGWLPNDIKITPERVYALTFHPIQEKPLVLAGDKKGTLGIFDASQPPPEYDEDDEDAKIPLPKVAAFELHTRTISSIKAPMFDQNSVFTSSYDSSIRCLDLPTQVSSQLWQPDDDGTDLGISCIDVSAEAKDLILFSTLDGSVGRIDRRAKGTTDIWGLTDNKIGGFSMHPLEPHLLATASLDRTLKIWDLRMIKGKGENAHPTLLGEHTSRLSVSHASWSRGGKLATSSYDDTVKIYDLSESSKWKAGHQISESAMTPEHSIRHNNQTGRWVTILKPQWQINPADGVEKFAIANMNRFVDIFDSNGKQLAQLEGEGITAVPAVAEFHPRHNWVAGGTGSGKLCLWM
ncbi:WD40-repeat-containing domain protein [Microdochium trichocladiopsis]|uniref:DNA damage-binding protein CMR1 n=1 Tax=Microdochium trichocladiopsis TaxID=1682393 RepID=A0A9P8XTP5_9PEZI|nr:WD40-repeat-containing domain protein [Microdochium trichocladiopsis]KAH7018155.1 WD40-repeat-containing domain protein [Microdochium trichocladiopsis]